MATFEIKNRWTGAVVYSCELSADVAGQSYGLRLGFAVKAALAAGSDLSGSNLRDSDLSGSNLRDSDLSGSDLSGSDLRGSDLRGSNLRDSDLSGSNLRGSDLSGSNLRDSDLSGSNLRDSDLSGSDLSGSDLRGSDLRGSNLSDSDLSGSNLTPIRDDVWAVLSSAPAEAAAVRDALAAGRVNGSTYSGPCACLVGTIAQTRGVDAFEIDGLRPNSSRPAESFFMAIREGDTPAKSQACALAHEWVSEWIERMQAAFGAAVTP